MDIGPSLFRDATINDLNALRALLADDPLGSTRENTEASEDASYVSAFEAIEQDPDIRLIVAECDAEVVGCLQLIFTPHLTYCGGWRATIEAVRVRSDHRGGGLGTALFGYAIEQARERGCHLVQLTTDKRRPRALAFYERLGFVASHIGVKLHLRS
jgi:GNAT superfamily N-acetyltransferase